MSQYQAKDSTVLERQLEVQELRIPFKVTHSATPASKVIVIDEPTILSMNFQSLTGISSANGSYPSGNTPPSLASATDSTGAFSVCLNLNLDTVVKVQTLTCVSRDGSAVTGQGTILANSTGTGAGQQIFGNFAVGVNFSSTDLDACIVAAYIVQE